MYRQFSCWIRNPLQLGVREWEMFPDGVDTSVMQAQLLGLSWNAWRHPAYSLPPTLPTQVIGVLLRRCLHTVTRRRPRLLKECCGRSNFRGFWRHFYFFHHFDITSGYSFSVTVRSMEVTRSLHKLWFMFGALAHCPVDGTCLGKESHMLCKAIYVLSK